MENKYKLTNFFLVSFCCILVIIGIVLFSYLTYLYYYDYNTYIAWLNIIRPFRYRVLDNVNPFICLAIVIIIIIMKEKDKIK